MMTLGFGLMGFLGYRKTRGALAYAGLRDDGQNGPPPLLTRSGAAGAWGSRGTKVMLELALTCRFFLY